MVWEQSELQTISLFRGLFVLAGGRCDRRQQVFRPDFTTTQNTGLCAYVLGLGCVGHFGDFDPMEMQRALLKSRLFAAASSIEDPRGWSLRMMASIPVGVPRDFLVLLLLRTYFCTSWLFQHLPSEILLGFGAQKLIMIQQYLQVTFLPIRDNNTNERKWDYLPPTPNPTKKREQHIHRPYPELHVSWAGPWCTALLGTIGREPAFIWTATRRHSTGTNRRGIGAHPGRLAVPWAPASLHQGGLR